MLMCMEMVRRVLRNQKGQGMAEYGLILALVAIVTVIAFTTMGGSINTIIGKINTALTSASSGTTAQ